MKHILLLLLIFLFISQGAKAQEERGFWEQQKAELEFANPKHTFEKQEKLQNFLDEDCNCKILHASKKTEHPYSDTVITHLDTILIDSCRMGFYTLNLNKCNEQIWDMAGYIERSKECRESYVFSQEEDFCNKCIDIEKSIYIKSFSFEKALFRVIVYLNKDYINIRDEIITKDDIYTQYTEFRKFIENLETNFNIFKEYKGSKNMLYFYFEDYVNLYDFVEVIHNNEFIEDYHYSLFARVTSKIEETKTPSLKISYLNGILEINSNQNFLSRVEIYDLFGHVIKNELVNKKQNLSLNLKLTSGIYFALINNRAIYKFSVVE